MSRPRRLTVKLPCQQCGKEKSYFPSQIKHGMGRFCSRRCKHASMQGQLFPKPNHPTLPIGHRRQRLDGYIEVKVKSGPGAYQLEHRLVAAEKYERPIGSNEHVHHLNGLRSDNRPENLEIIDPGQHARLSNEQGVSKRKALRRELVELRAQVECYERLYGKLPRLLEQKEDGRFCDHCGVFYLPPKPLHVRESRYCSDPCRLAGMHEASKVYHAARRPVPVPHKTREKSANPKKPCERCGTLFRKRWASETAKARFCSTRCALAVATEVRLQDYDPPESKMCAYCAQSYRPRYQVDAEASRYCNRTCWRSAVKRKAA